MQPGEKDGHAHRRLFPFSFGVSFGEADFFGSSSIPNVFPKLPKCSQRCYQCHLNCEESHLSPINEKLTCNLRSDSLWHGGKHSFSDHSLNAL